MLTVSGRKAPVQPKARTRQLLHSGIATRAFELAASRLADFVRVEQADLADGLLADRPGARSVPEAMKPHKIAIGGSAPAIEEKEGRVTRPPRLSKFSGSGSLPGPVFVTRARGS